MRHRQLDVLLIATMNRSSSFANVLLDYFMTCGEAQWDQHRSHHLTNTELKSEFGSQFRFFAKTANFFCLVNFALVMFAIVPFIFIGNWNSWNDSRHLQRNDIHTIINCTPHKHDKPVEQKVYQFAFTEESDEDALTILSHWAYI